MTNGFDTGTTAPKRATPWMAIMLVAVVAFIGWRMTMSHAHAPTGTAAAPLQAGMRAAPTGEIYACDTPENLAQSAAFRIAGAQDKLRRLVEQHSCIALAPSQALTVLAVKDRLVQVKADTSPAPLWAPVIDLAPANPH